MINIEHLKEICLKAGELILDVYHSEEFDIQIKEDKSPVTSADLKANAYIVKRLNELYPDIPILAEESLAEPFETRKNWKNCFIVDPIDGTKEFIKRNGEFTVNIAYAELGEVLEGVIYAPVLKTFYFTQNSHAYKQVDEKITKLPLTKEHSTFRVVSSRSHLCKENEEYIDALKKTHKNLEIVSKGSSLKFCMIAEGSADLYPRFNPTMEWDTAAAQAIVEKAGGQVLTMDSQKPFRYNRENLRNGGFVVRLGAEE